MSFKKLPCIPRFPYLLTLQLKRFDFDYSTMHRIKLNDRMWFPLILNLNSFIEREKVCLRAHAGHQPAYLKLVKCQKKFIYPARQWTTASPRVGCRHLSVRFKIDKRYPAARPSSKSLWTRPCLPEACGSAAWFSFVEPVIFSWCSCSFSSTSNSWRKDRGMIVKLIFYCGAKTMSIMPTWTLMPRLWVGTYFARFFP